MKRLHKIMALVLAFGLAATLFGACGGVKSSPNTETDLEIFYWNSGNGEAWLNKTIDAFQAKYPEVNVVKRFSEDNSTWETELVNASINTVDLYISTMTNFLAYTQYLEPLDDIMNEDVDGNGVKLYDKNNPHFIESLRGTDGKLYGANWGGSVCGLVYNKTVFDQEGYTVPRTTDELAELAGDMVDDKYIPFIHCGNADYWSYLLMPWYGQYSGVDDVYDFWYARYTDEEGIVHQPDIRAMKSEGKKVALEAMEKCVSPKGYTYSASNEKKHTEAQTLFLNGRALMMPNGSWLETEMKSSNKTIEVQFMKTPVVSELYKKLGVANDREFRELISYVDSADYAAGEIKSDSREYSATVVNKYSAQVIARIAEARNVVYSEGVSNRCIVPNYAVAKDYAKKFIQFLNSDEGLKIYTDEVQLRTTVTPTRDTVDTSGWTAFAQSAAHIMQNADYVCRAKGYPLFYNTSLFTELYPQYAQTALTAASAKDKKTAAEFWEECLEYYDKNWDAGLEQAGLK